MKNNPIKFKIALIFGFATLLALFVIKPGFSQGTAKKESHKKIVMTIVSDGSGKMTLIDTTMEISDTSMVDSIQQEIEKVMVINKNGKHARFKVNNMPQGFNYNFEMPSKPECPMDLEELEGIDCEGMDMGRDMEDCICDKMMPGMGRMVMRSGGNNRTLSDLLGNIPMDRVVSYSIKDRKNGKRIIIDLNDANLFESQDRVIVLSGSGKMQHKKDHTGNRVKVYVNTDDDSKVDSSLTVPPIPPIPPPPPIPVKQGKK